MRSQVNNTFRDWWEEENGSKDGRPKNKEVHEYLDIMAGGAGKKGSGWLGYAIKANDEVEDDEAMEDIPFM